jgi:hypothetical protein
MNTVILILVALSLVLSAVAYWRSGGAQDVHRLRGELEMLRRRQKDLSQSMADGLSSAYGRSRERLDAARDVLRR